MITPSTSVLADTGLHFVALGDTPYSDVENEQLRSNIIPKISQANIPFVVHYGDFKAGGRLACTKTLFKARRDDIYRLLPGRVFYTPGDNDWTDCDRESTTAPVSELQRLDLVRRLFFRRPLKLPASWQYQRQAKFPENARWVKGGVVFATVHIVGTNNGRQQIFLDDVDTAIDLVEARDTANHTWLEQTFATANKLKAKAIVIVTQADLSEVTNSSACTSNNRSNCDGFADYRKQLRDLSATFTERRQAPKPVLLLHGDTNPYCWDRDFGADTAPNLWRLNGWGDFQSPADVTEITVQPQNTEQPFVAQTWFGKQTPEACS